MAPVRQDPMVPVKYGNNNSPSTMTLVLANRRPWRLDASHWYTALSSGPASSSSSVSSRTWSCSVRSLPGGVTGGGGSRDPGPGPEADFIFDMLRFMLRVDRKVTFSGHFPPE